MRQIIFILSFVLICLVARANPDTLLNRLDEALQHKKEFTEERLQKLATLKNELQQTQRSTEARYNMHLKIFDEYKTLNFDSAFVYANKIKAEAERLNDPLKINRAKINLAFILLSSGMFQETLAAINGVDADALEGTEKAEYFMLKARYYYDLCDFVKNPMYCSDYMVKGNEFADVAIGISPTGTYNYLFMSGLKNLRMGNSVQARKDYLQLLKQPKLTDHQYAIIASTLSYLYLQKSKKNEAFRLLVEAAIADIKASTKENVALFKLADTLFKTGDNERAYRYIREAMADAEFYGARHRQFEAGTLLPIIEGKQLSLVEKQKNLVFIYAAIVTLLILLIAVFILVIVRQNKKLEAAKTALSAANASLHEINDALLGANTALREVNIIKDEYIGYYFNVNSDYIEKIERFKRSVSQRLTLGRYEDIKQIINKIDLKKEREDLSLGFDKVFIKLFPNFIRDFNALFDEKDRIAIPNNQILSAELRIFALIRLGIHDNDKIAKILGFSVNTIYSYKTRIKNKSFVPNDEFEDKIMEIKAD